MSDKFLSDQDVAAIKRHYKETVAQNQRLTDKELETAILVAEKRQLYPPPLGNHIFFMKRKNREQLEDGSWGDVYVLSLQTGIDGFRLIAERTNKYVGSGVPEYENDASGFVKRAIIRVEKLAPDGSRAIVGADAWFEEYAQYSFKKGGEKALTKMWAEKGRLMLSKCAEALALRKAFPELSGLYTTDEMGAQDDGGVPEAPVKPAVPPSAPPPQARPAAAAAAPAPTSSSAPSAAPAPPVTAPVAPLPVASPEFADPERKKKLANAMALSCSTFGVTRPEMVKLVRA
jgi:phage recombination protein Bet